MLDLDALSCNPAQIYNINFQCYSTVPLTQRGLINIAIFSSGLIIQDIYPVSLSRLYLLALYTTGSILHSALGAGPT